MAKKSIFLNCEECGFATNWDFSLASHVKNNHRSVMENGFNCNVAFVEKFLCPDWDCGTHMDFNIHMRRGHNWNNPEFIHEIQEEFRPDQWKCPECDFKTFSNLLSYVHNCKRNLLSELKVEDIQVQISLEPNKNKWLYCGHCTYKAIRKKYLKRHIMNRHLPKTKSFQCDQCSFKTGYKSSLKCHVADKHASSCETKCEHCSFTAKGKSRLNYHIKAKHSSHDDFHVFNCAHCDYKTVLRNHLNRHVNAKHMSDDKVKWFQCDQCTYKAKDRSSLRHHVMYHHLKPVDVKWFQCDQCTFKTKTRSNLKSHMIYNHLKPEDVEWFYCGHCDYKSKEKKVLKRHKESKHLKISN